MKKLFTLLVVVILALTLASCRKKYDLVIYLPNEYMDEELIAEFEKEYNVKVGVINFNSNEIALKQIKENPSSFDLIIPSDYAIEELIKEDLVEEIDWSKLSNFQKTDLSTDLAFYLQELEGLDFNFLKYSVPYFWGSLGLLYNNQIPGLQERIELEEWSILEDASLKKMIYDSSRDAYMVAFANSNLTLNTATQSQINTATNWLKQVTQSNAHVKSDEILDEAVNNKTPYDVAMVYSGDATYIIQENEYYNFYTPSLTNIWIDGFVIHKNAKNKDLAYKFIDFFSKKENQIQNALEVGYTPARQDAIDYIINEEEDYEDERILSSFLVTGVQNYEIYRYNKNLFEMIALAWIDVKNEIN